MATARWECNHAGAGYEAINEVIDDAVQADGLSALAFAWAESVDTRSNSSRAWWIAGCGLVAGLATCAVIGWALALQPSLSMAFETR